MSETDFTQPVQEPIYWPEKLSVLRDRFNARERFKALGPDRIVSFEYNSKTFHLHVPHAMKDKMQLFTLLTHQFHEQPLLDYASRFLNPGDLVVDAGANLGNHTVFFGGVCGCEVISVEPQDHVFAVMDKNRALNGIRGQAFHACAGARAGSATLEKARGNNSGTAQFAADDNGKTAVIALDDVIGDRPVRFMKVDVEGMQMPLLNGAQHCIERDNPVLWLELRPGHGELEEPTEWLSKRGYTRQSMTKRDFLFIPQDTN